MAQPSEEHKVDKNKNNNGYDPKDTESKMMEYMKRFQSFENKIMPYPIESNCPLFGKFDQKEVYKHMTQTYPICHGSVLSLAHQFLLLKRKYGSNVEKELYKDMKLTQFFNRISTKRAVVFYQKFDSFLLRNGQKGASGWEQIGTDFENIDGNTPLLADYLSYDELLIAALCGISSPTHFINNGSRRNHGRIDKGSDIYPMNGIYMGLIGARFEKAYVMEYQLMVITKDQNTPQRGYGHYKKEKNEDIHRIEKAMDDSYCIDQMEASKAKYKESKPLVRNIFESFYSRDYLPLYDEVQSNYNGDNIDNSEKQKVLDRWYCELRGWGDKRYLDKDMFRRRVRISLELFLFDTDLRCKENEKKGFCHLVGLGSGYWAFDKALQDREMVAVVLSIINDSDLGNISCVYFSWFDDECMMDDTNKVFVRKDDNGEYYEFDRNKKKIIIQFGDRNPADELKGEFSSCLICACYAWDSNAFPGNEYYLGSNMLSASGDPAAAACSTISYTQNSMINKEYVSGENTMFYFFDAKSGKYSYYKLRDIDFENNKEKWLKKSVLSIPYKRDTLNANNNNINDDEKSNKSNL